MIRTGRPCRVRLVPRAAASVFGAMASGSGWWVPRSRSPAQAANDPVLIWNEQTRLAIQETATDPFQASRDLALESIAVLDTVRSIASAPCFLVRLPGARDLNPAIAAAAAARTMLVHLFPARRTALDAALETSLVDAPMGLERARAIAFGNAVADAVYARRADDGWNAKPAADPKQSARSAPGQWRPTPPGFLPAQDPQWGGIRPFALTQPAQFRPAGPPPAGSAALREATAAVASIGAAQSAERTADQTEIARYWSDRAGSYGPAGQWNAVAASLVAPSGQSLEAEAQTFAELNVAMADAAIAVADAKYHYRFWRPVTVIREGAAGVPANPTWTPLLETPNQPGYIAEHAGFGGAAAAVLTARLGERGIQLRQCWFAGGDPQPIRTSSRPPRRKPSASEYGGIHYLIRPCRRAGHRTGRGRLDRGGVSQHWRGSRAGHRHGQARDWTPERPAAVRICGRQFLAGEDRDGQSGRGRAVQRGG